MSRKFITYQGVNFYLHEKQPYYYCSTTKKRDSKALHRQVYIDHFEEPKGFDIHHKDGDTENNDISNLEPIKRSHHAKLHAKKRVKENPEKYRLWQEKGIESAKAWHKSNKGREWHRNHFKKSLANIFEEKEKDCENCGKKFKYFASNDIAKFCHNNCKSAYRRKMGVDLVEYTCGFCGKIYKKNKYQKSKTCSRSCSNRKRKEDRDKEGL